MKNIILILLLMVECGCKPDGNLHKTIYFENSADYKIWVSYSTLYPDTITDPGSYQDIPLHSLLYFDSKIGFENIIARNAEKKIILFVKKDEPYVIVKRYILTLDSLNTLNWKITYP
jgi:hypothetical protein